MSWLHQLLKVLIGFTLLGTAVAAAQPVAPQQARPASACPELFGSRGERTDNAEQRRELLDSVRQADYTIDLTHTCDWAAPERIRFEGLKLIDTCQLPDQGRVAVIRVEDDLGEQTCEPGLYRLRVDDSIGDQASVLAVLRDVVLLERGGELCFLKTRAAEQPVFRMIWRSPWKLLKLPGASKATRATRRRSTKRRLRRKRRRRRRRR
jgi:hypothetical protein